MEEIWKPIDNFPYSVSNKGRVRRDTAEHNTYRGRIMKAKIDKDGYHIVRLCSNGKMYDRKVHILVCTAFNGPKPFNEAQVRHLDGDVKNFDPKNLCWGTAKQNAEDRARHGNNVRGERHSRALLSNDACHKLRAEYVQEKTAAQLRGKKYVSRGFIKQRAEELNIDRKTLFVILAGTGY